MMLNIGYILVVIHGLLLVWAVGGFLEMIFSEVPWKPFTNPEFPEWVLMLHWGSVLFASVSFLYGYFAQWSKTPHIMAIAYGLMATVCAIETFGYMTSETKYLAMAGEYLAYTLLLLMFFKSKYFKNYFYL